MSKKPKNKILIIFNANFLSSWLNFDIINTLEKYSDIEIALPRNLYTIHKIELTKWKTHIVSWPNDTVLIKMLFYIKQIKFRKSSISINSRLKRLIFGDLRVTMKFGWKFYLFSLTLNFYKMIKFAIRNPFRVMLYIPIIAILMEYFLRLMVFYNKRTLDLFQENFDLIIIPSSAHELDAYKQILYARNCGIKSLVAIENWDNLSSKAVFPILPDFTTVIGKTSVEYALSIHGLQQNCIFPIGIPRFEHYRNQSFRNLDKSMIRTKMRIEVIYLGFSLAHDELGLLSDLNVNLTQICPDIDFNITHRKHPFAQPRYNYVGGRVTRDTTHKSESPQMLSKSLPQINPEYLSQLSKYDLVISTPTSMAIECMLLNLPIIIDGTDDGLHRTSAGKSLKNYLHLTDLMKIEGLSIAKDVKNMADLCRDFTTTPENFINFDLNKIVNISEISYGDQLADALGFS